MGTTSDKLIYLNNTKQLIKENINNLGAELDNTNTFRSYANALDKIYEEYPKKSSSGDTITLTDVTEGKMETELNSTEISQISTTGQQLFNYEDTKTITHWTSDNEGWLTVSGDNTSSATLYANYFTNNLNLNTSTKYSVVLEVKKVSGTGQFFLISGHSSSQATKDTNVSLENLVSNTTYVYSFTTKDSFEGVNNGVRTFAGFTTGQSGSITCRISILADTSITPLTFNYEPYTGESAAPNPDYPFPVHTISGDNNIKIENKNFWNGNLFENGTLTGITLSHNDKGEVVLNGTTTAQTNFNAFYFDIPKNWTQLVLSGGTENVTFAILTYTTDNTYINAKRDSGNGGTYTIPSDASKYALNIRIASGITLNNYVLKAQIEQGSTATEYTPYQEQNYPINLSSKNLFNINVTPKWIESNTNYSINNNILKVTGPWYVGFLIDVEQNTDYYINAIRDIKIAKPSGGNISIYSSTKQFIKNITNPNGMTFNTGSNSQIYVMFYSGSGENGEVEFSNIQLEKGTTATDYEPYYNLEYCKIGNYKDQIFKTSGNNLINVSQYNNVNYISQKIYLKAGNYITSFVGDAISAIYVRKADATTPITGTIVAEGYNRVQLAFALSEDGDYYIQFYKHTGFTSFSNAQLNEGSSVLPYEPYGTNEWCIKKNIKKTILNGTEDWVLNSNYQGKYRYTLELNDLIYYNNNDGTDMSVLSDYFKGVPTNEWSTSINSITVVSNKRLLISSEINNVTEFKTWLTTHNTKAYYVLNTPEYINITENCSTLATQLENLSKAGSYDDITNISQINNDLPFDINISALEKGE